MIEDEYMESRQVCKAEFEEFIENYPRELTPSCIAFCFPEIVLYYDFFGKEGWEAVVAKKQPTYWIAEDGISRPTGHFNYFLEEEVDKGS